MSKSIFIINTPKCCGECPMSGTDVCRKWNAKDAGGFPKDCPLKEIPTKYEEKDYTPIETKQYIEGYEDGYNACVDSTLKERD